MELDIAIIGGGVSGAYCAWRLQQARGDKESLALFEYSDRIGGRLLSVALPGLPDVYAELGGMRYIPDQHVIVAKLIDYLGLPTKNFPMGAPPPIGANCNLFYLRGKAFRYHEIVEPGVLPYNLSWNERGLGPEALQTKIMNYIYPNFGNLTLCQQMKVKAFGKELWKYGFWDLLYRVLTNEGYQYMKDAGGYEANVANANAVTQLPATEYKDTTVFLTLKDGYDKLPITLAEQFRDQFPGVLPHGQRLHMNHRLARIEINKNKNADYPYKLYFQPTQTKNRKTIDKPRAKEIVVKAKQIILAMPRRSLELIDSVFFKDAWLQENIPSVLIQPAFKLFLAYEKPWWRSLGLVAGRSVTDLPIRQIYYFGTEGEQPGGYPFLNSLLMASYNDLSTVPFWKGLESGESYKGYQPACLEKPYDEIVPAHQFNLTDEMVTIAQRQIAQVHSQQEIPPPYTGIYHDWGEDPYGGGWHEWKANYRPDTIMCQMRHPVADQQIFIVGEAYSYDQGWVEGALETAESTLKDFFGMTSPVWMHDPNYPYLPNPCPGCPDDGDCLECTNCADMLKSITPNCFTKDDN